MPSLRTVLRRLSAVALGAILAVLAIELGARALGLPPIQRNSMRAFNDPDPSLGWIGAPDYRARFVRGDFDVLVESGDDGFRRAEPGPPAEARAAPAIAFLGDSFTWGFGVGQGERYTDVLQRALGARARVWNRGVNGYSTGQELLLLEERVLALAPAVVVVAFYFNDLFENGDAWSERRPWFELAGGELLCRNRPVARALSGKLYPFTRESRALSLLGFVASRAKQLAGREPNTDPAAVFPLDAASLAERWELQGALLAALRARCGAAGVELRVLYVAAYFDLLPRAELGGAAPLADARFGDELAARCAALGIPFLDSRAAFPRDVELGPRGEPYYYASDDHWTPLGHERTGAWLARELGL